MDADGYYESYFRASFLFVILMPVKDISKKDL